MIDRRRFLTSTACLAGLAARPAWALDADNPYRQDIGIQLYTLRDAIGADADAALEKVAAMGYQQVEAYGFPDCQNILDAAKKHDLPIRSSHINADPVLNRDDGGGDDFKRTLERAAELSIPHLVIPYIGDTLRKDLDDYRKLCDRMNRAAEIARSSDIQLSYHNHAFEFAPMQNDVRGYDVMIDEFGEAMKFEIDVFWVQAAGVDPVSLMKKLRGRVTQLHLKDLSPQVEVPTYDGMPKEGFEEIGDGVVAIESIIQHAADVGVQHCHVEQDHSPHPMQSIEQSLAVIQKM